jgi:tetratricopeptide (TPR) repeat protein
MGQKMLSSAYLSATLLAAILMGAPTVLAQAAIPSKEEAAIDLEKVKPPPRDIKDVLKVLQQSKPNAIEIDKAKAIVATPVPVTEDKEVLNTFYYKRAKAYQDLGKMQEAIADTLLTVEKYPASDLRMRLEDITQLGVYEGLGGKNTNAIKAYERAKAFQLSNLPRSGVDFK